MLLAHGAKLPHDADNCMTFLLYSSPELFASLMHHGIDVRTMDIRGDTALTYACPVADYTWLLNPIQPGHLMGERVDDGINPYLDMPAQPKTYPGLIERLIFAGAQVNATNDKGETALMGAAQSGVVADIQLLIKAGARVDVVDKSGKTALDYADEPWTDSPKRDQPGARKCLLAALHRLRSKVELRKHEP
jgi:ankyrin repeat protein